jgi:orotate phosphoribosyltransferase
MTNRDKAQAFIRHALAIGALKVTPEGFKLKSLRQSPHFFNSDGFRTGEDLRILLGAYVEAVERVVGSDTSYVVLGPPYKGIPLSYGYAVLHGGANVSPASYRKEAKDHGADKGIALGVELEGRDVVLIDDVTTTGESLLEAADYTRNNGGIIRLAVVGLDRQERSADDPDSISAVQKVAGKLGVPVVAAATLDDLVDCLASDSRLDLVALIAGYRRQYGVKPSSDGNRGASATPVSTGPTRFYRDGMPD